MFSAQEKSILVVDDLADNLLLLKLVLEAEGYSVEVADNGSAALAKVEEMQPDLMLLDVMMPEMTGYEVAQRIRQSEKLAAMPIVLITAYDEETVACGEDVGADGFIRKPIDFDELLARVRCLAA